VFGPVWTVLYLLMGISLYLVWTHTSKNKLPAYVAFMVQLALNTLWSVVFFGLHMPLLAVVVILLLVAAIVVTMVFFYRISKPAFYLLVPYLLWVCFATYLTIGIVVVN
jgi:translocator protein